MGYSTVTGFSRQPPLLQVWGSPGFGRRLAQPARENVVETDKRVMACACVRHQVARTITNLQQQIQQQQRQLAQALLVKPPPPPPHLSLHPSAGKSAMDSFPPHPQAPGLSDLQTKEQQSSPNTFAPYPLGESPWSEPPPSWGGGVPGGTV